MDRSLGAYAVYRGQILPAVAVLLIAQLVQKHTLPIRALLMPKPCRAVLGRTQLGSEYPVAILRPINCLDASGGVVFPLERHIDAKRLVLAVGTLATADRYLQNVAVLAKELGFAEGLK